MIFFIFIFSFSSFLCLFPFLCYFTLCGILYLSHILYFIYKIFGHGRPFLMQLINVPCDWKSRLLGILDTHGMWLSNHSCMGYTCVGGRQVLQNPWFVACVDGKTLTGFTSVHNSLVAFDKMEIQSKEEWTINSRCCRHFSIYLPWSIILLKIQNNSNITLLIFFNKL